MKMLALEFSSPLRGVAVAVDGVVRGQAAEQGERTTHGFALIDAALRTSGIGRKEIECIVVGTGPGSYAGIRIAISIAQGWQLSRGVKLIGVSSADALAAQAAENGAGESFTIGIDAQRQELFLARYEVNASGTRLVNPFHRAEESDWERLRLGEVCYRPDLLEAGVKGMTPLPPSASSLAGIAGTRTDFTAGSALEPIYLRVAEFVKAPLPRIEAT